MKSIVITVFTITLLFGLSYFVFYPFLTKEPWVAVPIEVTAPPGEVNYRKITFYVEDSTSDTEYLVKVDYLGVQEDEQYLINPINEADPKIWEVQERIPLSKKLEQGKEYNIVTKSYDKKLLEVEEYTIHFNNYTYNNLEP